MKIGSLHESISFTRDRSFHKYSFIFKEENRGVRFVIDGNKLSSNYKITPYNYFSGWEDRSGKTAKGGGRGEHQAEEIVRQDIKNIKNYIIRIDLPDVDVYDSILLTKGRDTNDFIEKMTGEAVYAKKYIELEEANEWTMDAKDYFEKKGFKVGFFK